MNRKSIFLTAGIFPVMLFCILTIGIDIWWIIDIIISKNPSRITKWWIIFLAIVALSWAGWRATVIYEKIACYIFGISLFLKDLSQFAEKEVRVAIMLFCVVLDIGATINFWICYKKFFQTLEISNQQLRNIKRLKNSLILLTIVLIGFITGVFFIWILSSK